MLDLLRACLYKCRHYRKVLAVSDGPLHDGRGPQRGRVDDAAGVARVLSAGRRYGLLWLQTAGMIVAGYGVSALAAYYFGATAVKDAWDVAYIIPWILLGVAGFENFQGVVTATFARLAGDDPDRVRTALSTIGVGLLALALALGFLAFGLRGLLVRVVAPGLNPVAATLASQQLAILAAMIPLLGMALYLGAVQVAYGYPGVNQTIWLVVRLFVIGALVALPVGLGVSRLSLGFVVGSAIALLAQLVLLRRTGLRFTTKLDFGAAPVREAFAQGGLFVLLAIATQACVVAERDLCSRGAEGTIAVLGYSVSLLSPMYQFVAKPLMLIEGPRIIHACRQSPATARQRYDRVVLVGLLAVVFAVAALFLLRDTVIRLLFQRGKFDALATTRASAFVAVMVWSAIGDALVAISALPAMVQARARWVPLAWTGGGLVQLVFMYAAFPYLSYMSVAWGAVLGSILRGSFAVWFSRRSLRRLERQGAGFGSDPTVPMGL